MLPSEKNKPEASLNNLTILVYGQAKIGKSTFCSKADKTLFLATEPGLNLIETWKVDIKNWKELLAACAEVEAGNHDFATLVIDTIDNAWTYCTRHICEKYGIDHESDLSYGKAYGLIKNEFLRVITRLAFLPYGLIFVSHTQTQDIKTRSGQNFSKIAPSLPRVPRDIIISLADLILYLDFNIGKDGKTKERVIFTKPTVDYVAGDRTGLLPEVLPLSFEEFNKYLPYN